MSLTPNELVRMVPEMFHVENNSLFFNDKNIFPGKCEIIADTNSLITPIHKFYTVINVDFGDTIMHFKLNQSFNGFEMGRVFIEDPDTFPMKSQLDIVRLGLDICYWDGSDGVNLIYLDMCSLKRIVAINSIIDDK